jgi:beta-N-acetylglucosaminidase
LVFTKVKEIELIIRQNEEENIYSADERDSEEDAECIYLKNELRNLERETMKSRMVINPLNQGTCCLEKRSKIFGENATKT